MDLSDLTTRQTIISGAGGRKELAGLHGLSGIISSSYSNRTDEAFQLFTGSLGIAAPAITSTGDSVRPYEVNGEVFVRDGALELARRS